jgi:hypothetical protein
LGALVDGGDDAVDLRAALSFQQREGVDQHRLAGDMRGSLLRFGQGGAGNWLCGRSGRLGRSRSVMMRTCCVRDMFAAHVAEDDTSIRHVAGIQVRLSSALAL